MAEDTLHELARDFLLQMQSCVRAVDFERARPLFAEDAIAFGTFAAVVSGREHIELEQWRHIWPTIRDFRPPNAALLVVDYPGYGASGGRATEAGMYEAADLAYNALIARPDIDRRRIYVYGRSLGSAAATYTASNHEVAGLILESPFTSARGMAAQHYRIFPRFLVRLELDNIGRIRRIHCPTRRNQ